MNYTKIVPIAILGAFIAGCSGNTSSLLGGSPGNRNCYDTSYAKSHIVVGKTTTNDLVSMCGDTKEKAIHSDGSESWTYRENDLNSGYDPVNSMLVKGFDRIQSAMGSSSIASQVGSEVSKANHGNANSITAANAVQGKKTDNYGYSSFYFNSKGVISSYSIQH